MITVLSSKSWSFFMHEKFQLQKINCVSVRFRTLTCEVTEKSFWPSSFWTFFAFVFSHIWLFSIRIKTDFQLESNPNDLHWIFLWNLRKRLVFRWHWLFASLFPLMASIDDCAMHQNIAKALEFSKNEFSQRMDRRKSLTKLFKKGQLWLSNMKISIIWI